MDKESKDRAVRRIRALREKTTERGATEAEMESALALADRLMSEYGVTETEAAQPPDYVANEEASRNRAAGFAANAVGRFTGTFIYVKDGTRSRVRVVNGRPCDVEIASYLLDLIDGAMTRAVAEFKRERAAAGLPWSRAEVNTFMLGMVANISERLDELGRARRRNVAALGTAALVPVADQQAAIKKWTGIEFQRTRSGFGNRGGSNALGAGRAAGSRVNLNPGIGAGGGKAVRLIGA